MNMARLQIASHASRSAFPAMVQSLLRCMLFPVTAVLLLSCGTVAIDTPRPTPVAPAPAAASPARTEIIFPQKDAVVSAEHATFPFVIVTDHPPLVVVLRVNDDKPLELLMDQPGYRVDVPLVFGDNEVSLLTYAPSGVLQLIGTRHILKVSAPEASDRAEKTPKREEDDPGATTPIDMYSPDQRYLDDEQPNLYIGEGIFGCALDVDVHRPISQDDAEPLIPENEDFSHGAYTLRNDDGDWRVAGNVLTDTLPVAALLTDLEQQNNDNENDLVRVDALNILAHERVYLFAFPLEVEADRDLGTRVQPQTGKPATAEQLGIWQDATKTAASQPLPRLLPAGETRLWLEGKRGGTYRLVIGILPANTDPADVQYNLQANTTVPALLCMRQATLTVVVVDIFQRRGNDLRQTAFDVYWGGLPYFEAEVWPGGGMFVWAARYKLGRTPRTVPGTAVTGRVAFMERDRDEDEPNSPSPSHAGEQVTAGDNAPGANKVRFAGGLQMDTPRRGDQPLVNTDRANRYPERVSLAYTVNGERLVRAEHLEMLVPQLAAIPPAALQQGNNVGVASRVQYTIQDAFRRTISARDVATYLRFYGAGLKAWEALAPDPGRTEEGGTRNDDVSVINRPAGLRAFPVQTAQRSQAAVHPDRMTAGMFRDTLTWDISGAGQNRRFDYFKHWTMRTTRQAETAARQEATDRVRAYNQAQGNPDTLRRLRATDEANTRRFPIFTIPQDVILQLRAGDTRYDINVLAGNTLTLYAPYFFESFAGFQRHSPSFSFHFDFAPGSDTGPRLVDVNHRRRAP